MRAIRLMTAACGAVAATGLPTATAQGQDTDLFQRDRYVAVTDRYQEAFDPPLVRLGTFNLRSNLEIGAEADDNIFADSTNEEGDVIVRLAPSADLQSDWARHQIGGRLDIDHREYTDFGSESATNLRGELRGRIDVSRTFDLQGAIFASDETEERSNVANLAVFAEPVQFQTSGLRAAARITRDRIRARATYEYTDYAYDAVALVGGGSASQDTRNYAYHRARGRVSYALSPDVAVFGQASLSQREYDQGVLIGGGLQSRDAEGYALEVGANFELPSLIRGDIAVGYMEDSKDSDVFADVSGLSVEAEAQWFPTQLTTVSLEASRSVIDPGLAAAGSATATDYGIRIDHELLRNVLLFGAVGLRDRDYEDINRGDERTDLRIGATYKMNRRFHFDGYAQRIDRDSSVATGNFEQNVLGVALRIYP